MILDEKQKKELDELVLDWGQAGIQKGGIMKDVSKTLKDIIDLVKKTDKRGLDEITFVLLFLAHQINNGQDNVQDLCELISEAYGDIYGNKPMIGEGETGMINPDGSRVTLKELGLD